MNRKLRSLGSDVGERGLAQVWFHFFGRWRWYQGGRCSEETSIREESAARWLVTCDCCLSSVCTHLHPPESITDVFAVRRCISFSNDYFYCKSSVSVSERETETILVHCVVLDSVHMSIIKGNKLKKNDKLISNNKYRGSESFPLKPCGCTPTVYIHPTENTAVGGYKEAAVFYCRGTWWRPSSARS